MIKVFHVTKALYDEQNVTQCSEQLSEYIAENTFYEDFRKF